MRVKDVGAPRGIALWILIILVAGALAPDAVANGLIGCRAAGATMPSVWASATAVGLTLITVVRANQK